MTSRRALSPALVSGGAARLPALLLSGAVAVVVCVVATWPRWHPAAPVVAPPQTPALAVPALAVPGGGASGAIGASGASRASAASASTPPVASPPSGAPPAAMRTPSLIPEVPDQAVGWHRLDEMQRIALAPFAAQWDRFSPAQQRKWLAIASVYPRMSLEAQQRLHARMVRWTQMTPDERRIARENYEMSRVLPPNARQQAWRAYQALPDAQKEKLAAAERSQRRALVVSAPPTAGAAPRAHHAPARPAHAASGAGAPSTVLAVPGPGTSTAGVAASSIPAVAASASATTATAGPGRRHPGATTATGQEDGGFSRP